MKVLHVFKTYLPDTFGGIERVINSIAISTAGHGVESTVLSLGEQSNGGSFVNGHRVVKAKRDFEIASTGFSRTFPGILKREAAAHDIVNYHFPWPFMDLSHVMVNANARYVVTYHSDIVRQSKLLRLYNPLMSIFLARAERIIATSDNYVSTSDVLAAHRDLVDVVPPGIEDVVGSDEIDARAGKWRQRFTRRLFVFTGMLRYYKGLEYLLAAARAVDADIAIVGSGGDEAQLKASAVSQGIENVHFLGRLGDADKFALLSISDGFVFPSHLRSEAYGMSLLEAAMMGKPMICCEIGTGTSFINIHGETGFVVPPEDPEALSDAMNRLLADRKLAERFGAAARRRFETEFTAKKMGVRYHEIYQKVIIGERAR